MGLKFCKYCDNASISVVSECVNDVNCAHFITNLQQGRKWPSGPFSVFNKMLMLGNRFFYYKFIVYHHICNFTVKLCCSVCL